MTTLENRPHTALMVIDVQNGVVAGNVGRDGVVANIVGLVDRARAAAVPVVWVQHSDSGLERGSVGDGDVAVNADEDRRMSVCHQVEVLPRGQRLAGPQGVVPAAADGPYSGLGAVDLQADAVLHLLQ